MKLLLKDAKVYIDRAFHKKDVLINDGIIVLIEDEISSEKTKPDSVFILSNKIIVPGLIDVHVHLREPGFLYKETVKTGTLAAAKGGFTHICPMPNLNPVPDSLENLKVELDAIKKDACVSVYPFGAITKNSEGKELSDMEAMAEYAVGFSDDGKGVQNDAVMEEAMKKAKSLNKIVSAHTEDERYLTGICLHDGEFTRKLGIKGISDEAEWKQIERDIRLAKKTGVKYHVCHVSAKKSIELIRKAKAEDVDISCETAPHYIAIDDSMLKDSGTFKMNPPIRTAEDRKALIDGIIDGTVDMIATDHAPHSVEEKSRGIAKSLNGIVGLETSFAVMYTELVERNIISIEKLMEIMHDNAKKRFKIGTDIEVGKAADIAVFDIENQFRINPCEFASKGKSTPFEGRVLKGKCLLTINKGGIVWQDSSIRN